MERRKYRDLIIALFALFIDLVGYGIIIPILPQYAKLYNFTEGQLGFLFASYWLVFVFTLIPLGMIVDKYGKRKIIISGMFLLCFANIFYTLVSSFTLLSICRILQGLAAACNWTASFTLAVQASDKSHSGYELSSVSIAIGLGTIAGPVIGGLRDIRFPFLLCGLTTFLWGFVCLIFLGEEKQVQDTQLKGRIRRIIKQSNFQAATLGATLVYLGFGMLELLFPIYLTNLDYPRSSIGILFSIQGLFYLIIQPLVGALSDKLGRIKPMLFGLLLTAFTMPLLFYSEGLFLWIILFCLIGIGVASVYTPSLPLVADGIDREDDQGSAYALYNTLVSAGFILGPWLGGILAGGTNLTMPLYLSTITMLGGCLFIIFLTKQPDFKIARVQPLAHRGQLTPEGK